MSNETDGNDLIDFERVLELGPNPGPEMEPEPEPGQDKPEEKAAEPVAQATDVDAEPEGIATADGKRIIPFGVLQSARAEAKEAKARAAALEQQLAAQLALIQQTAAQPEARGGAQATEEMTVSEWEEVLKQAKEDGDDLLAKAAQGALADRKRLDGLEKRLQEREQWERQQGQQRQQAMLDEARAAAQRHPDIAVWMEDDRMSAVVQEVERIAGNVPGSAVASAQTWDDYWKAVADTAAAMYPNLPRTKAATAGKALSAGGAKAAGEDDDAPYSMSGMNGGLNPGMGAPGDVGALAAMPRSEQSAALQRMLDQGNIFDFLDGVPTGSLNASG